MKKLASVEILGGGPAGLYTAILLRRMMPHVRLRVTEQNAKARPSDLASSSPIRRWTS